MAGYLRSILEGFFILYIIASEFWFFPFVLFSPSFWDQVDVKSHHVLSFSLLAVFCVSMNFVSRVVGRFRRENLVHICEDDHWREEASVLLISLIG